jgi:protoheme IX farnesyltransferase
MALFQHARGVLRAYSQLTKTGIILFALVSALAGYAVSFRVQGSFDLEALFLLIIGLYFVSAGAFAINQAQEWKLDSRMKRTCRRPIPKGVICPIQGYLIGTALAAFGLLLLSLLGPWPAGLALLTIVLYNFAYTLYWKKRSAFGAVPGAIPGAMPVVIGFSVNDPHIWRPECLYLFAILFLWQMPHFWALAIHYREDYREGGIPVLPVSLGISRALYHVGLYVFAYVGVALMAPWFLRANVVYFLLVLPVSLKVIWEFQKYFRSGGRSSWLPFFLWTNLSLLVYLSAPVMDKWISWLLS